MSLRWPIDSEESYRLLRRAKRRSNPKNISPIIGIASSVASLLSRKDSEIYVFRNPK
ncbi:MAG: hypothetical protein GWO87_01955 [Xanthomonadaceae bacterium]|nr:hypothetical protein [Rhodospirillaceae bacterium]NIA17934.1 hypothetical protein [Xanthomonadaceae bacterium]